MDGNRSALMVGLRRGLVLAPLLFLALFYFYPLLSILAVSLAPDGHLDLSAFSQIITSDYYRSTLWFTLWQATLSTVMTLALGLAGAYVFARYEFRGKSLLLSLSLLSFVLPTVVVAAAFTSLVGPNGVLNTALMALLHVTVPPIQLEHTLAIILIVHVFYNYSLALRMIAGYWMNVSHRMEEAARVLGAHGWQLWWRIRLPILRPAILAAAVLVFVFTFTSFGVVLILGGPKFATLEVEIYQQAVGLFNLPVAAALSLVQIGVMLVLMAFYARLQRRATTDVQRAGQVARHARSLRERLLVMLTVAFTILFLFMPLLVLVARSFTGMSGFTTQYYQQLSTNTRSSVLFVPPALAIGNSLRFALATTVLATLLGLITAYLLLGRKSRISAVLDPLFMLPLATSAVTLGFGYIIALDKPPLNLRTSPLLIVFAHTLVAMPFVVRSVLPSLRRIAPSIQEAARVLGASSWQVWRFVDLPLISRGLMVGAIFAFTVSMGEFGASLFVARPDTPTMPIVIFRLLGQPGALNYGQALAMSVLLMVVSASGFVLIERLHASGEF